MVVWKNVFDAGLSVALFEQRSILERISNQKLYRKRRKVQRKTNGTNGNSISMKSHVEGVNKKIVQ